ncbi:heptaprenyl diphosphate synthase component 1 [Oceanobacillus luteolus]|uniref:Heptaprenyl diphosphate synthase component 1 n=1 Tax=Oceanobacillus luteolus TaxID=1274358 RepID=A0ABW4HU90_9BACI
MNEITLYKEIIENKTNHDFLRKTIHKPVIDEDKLFILLKLIPKDTASAQTNRDVYIITTMLVQVALDTHELVMDNDDNETDDEKLVKQLYVLAGDYYSGLYYYLLSEIDDLTFIHKLASAIKAINERKMKLYYGEYETFSEYTSLKVEVESLLIETVANYFQHIDFIDCVKQWQYIKLLSKEKERIVNDEILLNSMMDSKKTNPYMTAEDKFSSIIQREWTSFNNKLMKLPHSTTDLQSYFNQKMVDHVYRNTLNAEEG